MTSVNLDIRHSNNARVEMAIADFFHSQNIPDAVEWLKVQSSRG